MTSSTQTDKTPTRSGWAILGGFLATAAHCVLDACDESSRNNAGDEHCYYIDGWKDGPEGYGYYQNSTRLYRD